MPMTCPKCSRPLPEVKTLKFRFCPHCGAEIAAEPQQLEDAFLTIPPDPPPPKTDRQPMDLSPETDIKTTTDDPFDDQTITPQTVTDRQQLKLKPPDSPPPASFYRNRSDEKRPTIRPAEKVPPKIDQKKEPSSKNRKIIIATLVILVIIILVLGAIFSF